MRVCVIGPGYVGLVTAACFAEMGNDVLCVGKPGLDDDRIARLNRGECPIYEVGLEGMIQRNLHSGRLQFGLDIKEGIRSYLFLVVAVPTPADEDGSADLQHVLDVARNIGELIEEYRVVIVKSTVPVGTSDAVRATVEGALSARGLKMEFDVVSNPEFLKEGDAVQDFMKPDRIIVGCNDPRTAELVKALYAPFARVREKLMIMDVRSAEMTKYAANAMLATKISFMNEMAKVCEKLGADVAHVRRGIGSDPRIGYQFIYPGVGFGGSCFPKDLRAIISMAREGGVQPRVLEAVEHVNLSQKLFFSDKIIDYFAVRGGIEARCLAVWGLSFKPNTNDMREAPSAAIIRRLLDKGARIQAFDPEAMEEARKVFGDRLPIRYSEDHYDALDGADALVLITEWNLFRNPDFEKIKRRMKTPLIFDGRNQYDPELMARLGFIYISVGRSPVNLPAE
ncbi:MAG: UDP-glucose/GDP-mannose dehydrogenase family protein [Deltaproteobacteria bacterium]|nr:UDP-glucose/GDP-mannose dehydrogenase family protein [Deltaproteobacteria bacterium]